MGKGRRGGGDGIPDPSQEAQRATRREAADYIAGLLEGLKTVAKAAGLPFVAYLLAVTIEAAQAEKARDD